LLWTIALIAALSFVFVACGGDDDPDPVALSVYIETLSDDPWTGEALTAVTPEKFEGEITYAWTNEAGTSVGQNSDTYSPTAFGTYTVTVTSGSETAYDSVLVGPKVFGTWYLNSSNAANKGLSDVTTAIDFNETLTITNNSSTSDTYIVVETKAPGASGTAGGYTFTITSWTKVDKSDLTITDPPTHFASAYAGCDTAYRVQGTFTSKSGDYAQTGNANFTGTYFYILAGNDKFVRTVPKDTNVTTGIAIFPRLFEKTKSSTGWPTTP
jgi:hypothetical protein